MQDVLVAERTVHFWITGHSTEQLADAIRVMGPRRAGERYGAYTDWSVRYSVGRCGALVHVEVITTLPRWIEPRTVSNRLIQIWRSYLDGLVEHERGHRDIAVTAGRALLAELNDGHPDPPTALAGILDKARIDEQRFDADTQHGATDPRISDLSSLVA